MDSALYLQCNLTDLIVRGVVQQVGLAMRASVGSAVTFFMCKSSTFIFTKHSLAYLFIILLSIASK